MRENLCCYRKKQICYFVSEFYQQQANSSVTLRENQAYGLWSWQLWLLPNSLLIALFIDQPLIELSHPFKNQSPVKWMKYTHSQLIAINKAWYTRKEKEKATMQQLEIYPCYQLSIKRAPWSLTVNLLACMLHVWDPEDHNHFHCRSQGKKYEQWTLSLDAKRSEVQVYTFTCIRCLHQKHDKNL